AVAVLQEALDLLFAVARRLGVGAAPRAHRVADGETGRQLRRAVDRLFAHIARRALAEVVAGEYAGAERQAAAAQPIAEAQQSRFGIELEPVDALGVDRWRRAPRRQARVGHRH